MQNGNKLVKLTLHSAHEGITLRTRFPKRLRIYHVCCLWVANLNILKKCFIYTCLYPKKKLHTQSHHYKHSKKMILSQGTIKLAK